MESRVSYNEIQETYFINSSWYDGDLLYEMDD